MKRRLPFLFLLVISLLYRPVAGLSADSSNLSGMYKGYNIILIILNTLRPDRLGCYGYSKNTSPAIDTLAQEGVIFKNAFSQAPFTSPSIASIFTSLYPFSHQVSRIPKDSLPQRVYTLAQILHDYGYRTVWFGDIDDLHSQNVPGVLRSFDEKQDVNTASGVLSWIEGHSKENFFVTIHCYQAHNQYFPYSRFNNVFSQQVSKTMIEKLDGIREKAWKSIQKSLRIHPESIYDLLGKEWVKAHQGFFMRSYSEENVKRIFDLTENEKQRKELRGLSREAIIHFVRSLNEEQILDFLSLLDSSIFETDNTLIKQLVNKLKEMNLQGKTIIIITADHGNEFKEHGHIGHGRYLYDESIHIPLIFHLPHFQKALRIEELAESVDILPTTLDLVGITAPDQSQGISLVDIMAGRKGALTKEYVLSQSITGLASIRSKEWKLIMDYQEGKQGGIVARELFDMKKDPGEKNNLINVRPEKAKQLEERFTAKLSGMYIYQDSQGEFPPTIDEKTRERIKKTGYW